jgi:hypothetical protein
LPSKKQPPIIEYASAANRETVMFCLDDGLTLDALFVFAAFALVFAIGLGLGVLARGG